MGANGRCGRISFGCRDGAGGESYAADSGTLSGLLTPAPAFVSARDGVKHRHASLTLHAPRSSTTSRNLASTASAIRSPPGRSKWTPSSWRTRTSAPRSSVRYSA